MFADPTQALIDRTRRNTRFHPFNRLSFWLTSATIAVAACAVAWMLRYLFVHRMALFSSILSQF